MILEGWRGKRDWWTPHSRVRGYWENWKLRPWRCWPWRRSHARAIFYSNTDSSSQGVEDEPDWIGGFFDRLSIIKSNVNNRFHQVNIRLDRFEHHMDHMEYDINSIPIIISNAHGLLFHLPHLKTLKMEIMPNLLFLFSLC